MNNMDNWQVIGKLKYCQSQIKILTKTVFLTMELAVRSAGLTILELTFQYLTKVEWA